MTFWEDDWRVLTIMIGVLVSALAFGIWGSTHAATAKAEAALACGNYCAPNRGMLVDNVCYCPKPGPVL